MQYRFFIGFVALIWLAMAASCRKDDDISQNPDFQLRFSVDTLHFDTVFTSVGTTTQWLKVYNTSDKDIRIQSIGIDGGNASRFRMNVDGIPGVFVQDVEIEGNDSIFIFVRATIDPNQANTPMVIEDAIRFTLDNREQRVPLVAWGQDAYFYRRAILRSDFTWSNDKPHVIYDYVLVDSSFRLQITEGTTVYMHAHSVLAVNKEATLIVSGSRDNPVKFRGDRLEKAYEDIPGQWGRIWLSAGSINNTVDYAILENGQVGLHVDTLGNSGNPTLRISNSIIRNMSSFGMLLQGTWVEASNCVISDCGEFSLVLNIGGKYDFRHCTVGNYFSMGIRQTPSLVLNNYYIYNKDTIARPLTQAYFSNCIIWGRNSEEFLMDKTGRAAFEYQFDHCIIRSEQTLNDPQRFIACLRNADPLFVDPYQQDLRLKTGSPAIGAGNQQTASGIPFDIAGQSRLPNPDIGAYQYVPDPVRK